jgi:hypothetical protein
MKPASAEARMSQIYREAKIRVLEVAVLMLRSAETLGQTRSVSLKWSEMMMTARIRNERRRANGLCDYSQFRMAAANSCGTST